MSHAITRTSPKGGPFIGRCIKCGAEGLGMGAPLEACPADGIVSDEQLLMEMLATPIDWKYTSVALWRLLDDIDTQDDASRGNDLHFRNSTRDIQRKRFEILSGEEFDRAARPAQPTVLPHHAGYDATRTDISQASVAAALEAAAGKCDAFAAFRQKQLDDDEAKHWQDQDAILKRAWKMSISGLEAAASEIRALITPAQHDALAAHVAAEVAKARAEDAADSFAVLIADARAEAERAMSKFPQPNYVISKFAEEAGEVVKAAIHYAEKRETAENVRGEMKQAIAMLYRLWVEGDQVHGMKPLAAAMAMVGLKAEGV